jgi:predicted MPP superfamily phosphohydrolase
MGVAFLLLVLLGASDLVLGLGGAAAWAAGGELADAEGTSRARAALVAGAALVLAAVGMRGALRPPALRRIELRIPRWPAALDGFRIAQISDVHIGPILGKRFARHVVERVNALSPDLIAVTGDLVDGSVRRLGDEVAPFADLRADHGVYFVTGNHDHYSGARSWVARAAELGMRPLRNECVAIARGAAAFDLAGVDDAHGSWLGEGGGEDLERALAGRDRSRPVVLLAHDPSTWKRASRMGVDLQLSGHTHGGQIWPFFYFVRLVIPWVAGLYERAGSLLYVSRGTGFWGPPLRLLAPAEITEISLRCGAEA